MDFKTYKIRELAPIVENEKIIVNICDTDETVHHGHRSFLEFAYVIQGRANHIINDESSILKKGDFFIIDFNSKHRYTKIGSTPFIIVNCLFTSQLIDQTLNNCQRFEEVINNYLINFDFCQLKQRPTNLIMHDDDGHIWQIVRNLCEEYERKDIGYLESMRCQLILLLIDIMRQLKLPNAEENESEKDNDIVDFIIKYVNKHYTESISLKELADKYNYSSAHISNLFKRKVGINFSEYLQSLRIQESCRLLANTNKNIAEIVNLVGYTDVKFFNKVFKRITGMTPRQFKQSYIKKSTDSQ